MPKAALITGGVVLLLALWWLESTFWKIHLPNPTNGRISEAKDNPKIPDDLRGTKKLKRQQLSFDHLLSELRNFPEEEMSIKDDPWSLTSSEPYSYFTLEDRETIYQAIFWLLNIFETNPRGVLEDLLKVDMAERTDGEQNLILWLVKYAIENTHTSTASYHYGDLQSFAEHALPIYRRLAVELAYGASPNTPVDDHENTDRREQFDSKQWRSFFEAFTDERDSVVMRGVIEASSAMRSKDSVAFLQRLKGAPAVSESVELQQLIDHLLRYLPFPS